jgi:hypothetical protein
MNLRVFLILLLFVPGFLRAETEISAPETESERQETTSDQEWEAKDIIPNGGLTVSTQPITPITVLPDRKPYDQALVELALAQDLWKNGKAEATSDVALEAYDDLTSMHLARRNKKQRQKLRLERRQAATVYIDSSIAYIQEYVKKGGSGPHAIEEGRARLGDLRDVAQNYPELTKKLNAVTASFGVETSSTTATVPPVAISTMTKS